MLAYALQVGGGLERCVKRKDTDVLRRCSLLDDGVRQLEGDIEGSSALYRDRDHGGTA
jgi:hypothetical protein